MLTNQVNKETSSSAQHNKKQHFFQPKLSINQPNDVYEQEADAVADKVMRMKDNNAAGTFFSPPVIQRKCAHCEEEEKQVQKKPVSGNTIQRQDKNEPEQQNATPPLLTGPFIPQLTPPSLLAPTDSIDYLGIRQTLFNRGVLFPGQYLEDGQKEWVRQYLFYSQLHLGGVIGNSFAGNVLKFFGVKPPGGDWNAWLSNTTTPLAVDSALSRDFPTFNEQEERRGGLPNPTIINAPAIHFKKADADNAENFASPETESYINNLSGGQALSKNDENFYAERMGYDFSDVRIHNDAEANQSAKSVNALAYTHGNNIVFGAGQYQPGSENGKRLMAHELTHVVQQSKNISTKKIQRLDDASFEASSGVDQGIANGTMTADSINGQSYTTTCGFKDYDITFKFSKAYKGTYPYQAASRDVKGVYVKIEASIKDKRACGRCSPMKLLQTVRKITKNSSGDVESADWNNAVRNERAGWNNSSAPSRGWMVDRLTSATVPFYTSGANGTEGSETIPAIMYDSPGFWDTDSNVGMEFYTSVTCENLAHRKWIAASVSWGFYTDSSGAITFRPATPVATCGNPQEVQDASTRWDAITGNTATGITF